MDIEYESNNIIKVCSSKEDADDRIKRINYIISELHSCCKRDHILFFGSSDDVVKDPLYKELISDYKIEEMICNVIANCLKFRIEEWDVV
jgi:hypothetical protein